MSLRSHVAGCVTASCVGRAWASRPDAQHAVSTQQIINNNNISSMLGEPQEGGTQKTCVLSHGGCPELHSVQHLSLGGIWGSPPPPSLAQEEGKQAAGACSGNWGSGRVVWGSPCTALKNKKPDCPQLSSGIWRYSDLALNPEATTSDKSLRLSGPPRLPHV